MNFQNIITLVNRLLDKIEPGVNLGVVSEETFESTLAAMLDMHDQLESLQPADSGYDAFDPDFAPVAMRLASAGKRRGVSAGRGRG